MANHNVAFDSGTEQLKYAKNGVSQEWAPTGRGSGGCFVSQTLGLLLFVGALILAAAVGTAVYYAALPSCASSSSPAVTMTTTTTSRPLDPQQEWQKCLEMAEERQECLCPQPRTTPASSGEQPGSAATGIPTSSEEAGSEATEEPSFASTDVPTTPETPLTGLRLNASVTPTHYNVELQPHIYEGDDFSFDGAVEIWVECHKPTNQIVLHISQLTLNESSVCIREDGPTGDQLVLESWEIDEPRQFLIFTLGSNLEAGRLYHLSMEFRGTHLHQDFYGFYRSTYTDGGVEKSLVVTQFQPSHARRCFPCFDEPSMKATFNITLVRRAAFTSIAGMPVVDQEARSGDWVADVYEQTVLMSPYLLAFVVSEFQYRESTTDNGTYFRIWSRPSFLPQLDYALAVSGLILEAFEEYTGIPYPLPKTDQIAVPDFAAGAMENWGLITYREQGLCWNPNFSTMSDKRYIATIISHELAHQWFGNLVTCDWWDDTWLNEGFANFFADLAVSWVEPTWKMDEYYLRTVQYIMNYDESPLSQPVYLPDIDHHDDIPRAFSTVTYRKGGSVIRMMRYFLSEETFQKAIQTYLSRHAYRTVTHEDLYAALQEQAEMDGMVTWDTSLRNFSMLMDTWIEQMNHPLVTVTTAGGNSYRLTQELILNNNNTAQKYDSPFGAFLWDIPVTYASQEDIANGTTNYKWMYRETSMDISGLPSPLHIVNVFQQGFYRVAYESSIWNNIIEQLKSDPMVFPVMNRAQLIDDAFRLATAGYLDEVSALRTTEYMTLETEYLPWYAALNSRLPYIEKMFYSTPVYMDLQKYLSNRVIPAYDSIGWNNSDPDEHIEKYMRIIVLDKACDLGHRDCIDAATTLYQQWMDNPEDNPISPDLRIFVYCAGIRHGGFAEWEFARHMYIRNYTEYIASEKAWLLQGMACTSQPWLQRRYLELAVEWRLSTPFNYLADKPEAQDTVLDFIKETWGQLPFSVQTVQNALTRITDWYSTQYELAKFQQFTEAYTAVAYESYYESTAQKIAQNIAWVTENLTPIHAWLQAVDI